LCFCIFFVVWWFVVGICCFSPGSVAFLNGFGCVFVVISFVCAESGVFPSELLFLLCGVWVGICCLSPGSVVFLNGLWCVFVVLIFLVWSLVFFRRNYCVCL